MASPKSGSSSHLIPSTTFSTCLIDGLTLNDICKLYTRRDVHPNRVKPIAYRLDKLVHHLRVVHAMTLIDYCRRYGVYDWPQCPIRGTDVGYRIDGRGVHLSTYVRGAIDTALPANQAHYERMRKDRKGTGNPMHGKPAWNVGLNGSDPRMAGIIESLRTREVSEETRDKMKINMLRLIAERGPLHAMPHSEETKQKARVNTARLWAEGVFSRTSSIHIKMREYLKTLSLTQPVVEEYQVKWFSMDFAFPKAKVAIECQGSYYHIDPRFYPNGPENAMQRRNWGRDIAKRKVCCDQEGWTIIEVWEPEINDGSFQTDILCKLKQYGLLD